LVEQNVSRALTLVHRAYVFESGKVIMQGTSAELANNKQVQAGDLGGVSLARGQTYGTKSSSMDGWRYVSLIPVCLAAVIF
jgi:hypothetical protein